MANPKVSIVIPALNEEKVIEEALNSIRSQKNAPKYELIISDGKSTDRTVAIAKKYADQVVYEPKRTISAGRHAGMLAASGDILVSANADNFYPENWLSELVKPFEKNNIAGALGKTLPKDGDFIDNAFAHAVLHPVAYLLSKVGLHYVDSSNMAVRKAHYFEAGGFNPDMVSGEDTELIKRIKKHGEVVYAPEALAYLSMRRVKKWGKIYYTYFHTTNFIRTHFFHKGHAKYEPIRE